MEQKFHRESAKIYSFVAASRPAPGERVEPRLCSADVVPLRLGSRAVVTPAAETVGRASFGSGWYHDAAIEGFEPSRH